MYFKEFLLEGISDNEFQTICTTCFSKVKREFTDGQIKSQRVDLLLEQVQKENGWTVLSRELKKCNPGRHEHDLEPHGY